MSRARDLAAFVSNADGDIKFDTDTLFIDSSANHVGIGTSSPDTDLHVEANIPVFRLTNPQSTSSLGLSMGKIEWETRDSSAAGVIAHIDVVDSNNFGTTFDMAFATGQSGSATERMRIDSSGNVGIGTSSPKGVLDIAGDQPDLVLTATDTSGAANQKMGAIKFYNSDPSGDGPNNSAIIEAQHAGSIGNAANLVFKTINAGTEGADATEAMRITNGGDVGIGTSSPSEILHVATSGGASVINLQRTNTNTSGSVGTVSFTALDNHAVAAVAAIADGNDEGAHLSFRTTSAASSTNWFSSTTEAMRVSSNGQVFIAGTTGSFSAKLTIEGGSNYTIESRRPTSVASGHLVFRNSNGAVGSIITSGSATSYNTSSDYRLKENVTNVTDGITRVKQLAPKRFNFIADADTTVDGFIAHEVQTVIPEAVTGTKDAMRHEEYEVTPAVLDDEGNVVTEAVMGTRSVPDYQGIDQSKLVPLLTAALQEAIAKIETLETKVAALESA